MCSKRISCLFFGVFLVWFFSSFFFITQAKPKISVKTCLVSSGLNSGYQTYHTHNSLNLSTTNILGGTLKGMTGLARVSLWLRDNKMTVINCTWYFTQMWSSIIYQNLNKHHEANWGTLKAVLNSFKQSKYTSPIYWLVNYLWTECLSFEVSKLNRNGFHAGASRTFAATDSEMVYKQSLDKLCPASSTIELKCGAQVRTHQPRDIMCEKGISCLAGRFSMSLYFHSDQSVVASGSLYALLK